MERSPEDRSLVESFENRRRYPRLNLDLPVTISDTGGKKLAAQIYNVSPDGIQIRYQGNDGVEIFRDLTSSGEEFSIASCILEFDLEYKDKTDHIEIDAFPLYTEHVSDDEMACGMFFGESKLSENKKISDYLFNQLQVSFADMEMATAPETVIDNTETSSASEEIRDISRELDDLILLLGDSNTNIEPVRELLQQIINRLSSNRDILQQIEERISRIQSNLTGQ